MMGISSNVDAFAEDISFGGGGYEDDLSSQINGITNTFVTTYAFNTSSIVIYYNGVRQRTGVEVTVVNARTVQLDFVPELGTTIVATYTTI
jgi:hypothetical protein